MGSASHSLQGLLHGGMIPEEDSSHTGCNRTHAHGMDLMLMLGFCISVVYPVTL